MTGPNSNCGWIWRTGCAFFLAATSAFAQAPCAADAVAEQNALRLPHLAAAREKLQQAMDSAMAQPDGALPRTVIRVPVVVHVVYIGLLENISDDQIQSQLDVLNEDFRKDNPDINIVPPIFAPLAADAEITFCLADRDPGGTPSSGITRVQTTWNNIGQQKAPDGRPRINYTELGGQDAWDPTHYLNIWVARIGGDILGYGTFPGTAPPAEDGVVIDPRYFGRNGLTALYPPHHLGRTATHEVGHYLNLRHIWGGSANSCNDDDDVADTPVQRSAYGGCPVHPQLSCGNTAMFMNFMDYTDDACMAMFTNGQKTRMRAALMVARSGLMEDNMLCLSSPVSSPTTPARLHLWPNPAVSTITVQLDRPLAGSLDVRVRDIFGRLCPAYEEPGNFQEEVSVDIAALPAGAYYLTISAGQSVYTLPFIKL